VNRPWTGVPQLVAAALPELASASCTNRCHLHPPLVQEAVPQRVVVDGKLVTSRWGAAQRTMPLAAAMACAGAAPASPL